MAPHQAAHQAVLQLLDAPSLRELCALAREELLSQCGDGKDAEQWIEFSEATADPKGSIRLSLSSRPSIGTENPIPEEMDHREIAVRVPVMNEVQFLFPSEPCKPLKPRSLYVVFLVEKDVRVE
jgi:hypothetical protein